MYRVKCERTDKMALIKTRLLDHEIFSGHLDFTATLPLGVVCVNGVCYNAVAYEQINRHAMATMEEWRAFLESTGSAFLGAEGAEALLEQVPNLLKQGYGYVTPLEIPSADERGRMVTSALTFDRYTDTLRVGHDMTYSNASIWKHNMRFIAFVPQGKTVHH